jgi:hypothetical protein
MNELAVLISSHIGQMELPVSTVELFQKVLDHLSKDCKKTGKFDLSDVAQPPNLNGAKWLEWVDNRKACGKQVTKVAAKKQLEFLSQYPPIIQAAIIDQSIMNGYQGLFAPKGIQHGQTGFSHSGDPRPDTSAAGRVRAEVESARAKRAAVSGADGVAMADDGKHVRSSVGEQLRGSRGPGQRVAELLEGDYRREP